jgi:arylsulfatase A-like enzyme
MQQQNLVSRRDFLKLVSLAPAAWLSRPIARSLGAGSGFNVIILVFDALSAHDVSLYGYPRNTMPGLEQFAQNAVIYHNHYTAGTFTVPGTASLLSGTYPWTHRAFQLGGGIARPLRQDQVFAALRGVRSTIAYGQNKYADLIIGQAGQDLDRHIPSGSFNLQDKLFYSLPVFQRDQHIAYASLEDNIFQWSLGEDSSLFAGPLYRLAQAWKSSQDNAEFKAEYPRGLPTSTEDFTLSDVADGAIGLLRGLNSPSFLYIHFHPPHAPYRPIKGFAQAFQDQLKMVPKPIHPLATRLNNAAPEARRRAYDQYIASWDHEVNRLFGFLKDSGLLDQSYVFITSDHGEIFERGEVGHFTPLMFDPLLHVPLVVSIPGQQGQKHVHALTSGVDILPTVATLTGARVPAWAEGRLLPELGGVADEQRGVFTVDAKSNPAFAPLTRVSVAETREGYRLSYYKYRGEETFELYDLNGDPEELKNLYGLSPRIATLLKDELMQKLSEANRPYEKSAP